MSCMGEQPGLTSSQALLLRANLGAILEAMEQTNATSRFLMPFLVPVWEQKQHYSQEPV